MTPDDEPSDELPLPELERIHDVASRFALAWRGGVRPSIGDYLEGEGAVRIALLRELVFEEWEARWNRDEQPTRAEYLERYPELAAWPDAEWPGGTTADADSTAPVGPHDLPPTAERPQPGATGADGAEVIGGQFELLVEIARGGMGAVYRARDLTLPRIVAVKVVRDELRQNREAARRFLSEAQVSARLQHPGIPPVFAVGSLSDGSPFLAMKLIEGPSLAKLLQERPSPADERSRFLAVFEQVCQAVGYAHTHGVIHRDLKPSNVMVGVFGEVQVMDWGLAKILRPDAGATETGKGNGPQTVGPEEPAEDDALRLKPDFGTEGGRVIGTPAFMAPEQAAGQLAALDERTDVFGLGALLAVILTGKPPYVAPGETATLELATAGDLSGCSTRLDSSGAEPELVELCKRCLSPAVADRPKVAGEVAKAVADFRLAADERAHRAKLDLAKAKAVAREKSKRRRLQLALAATVAIVLIASGWAAWWKSGHDADLRAEAFKQQVEADKRAAIEEQRLGRNRDALESWAGRCEFALRMGDAVAAETAVKEIDRLRHEGGGETIQTRLDRYRADLALLRDLDRIDDLRWTPVNGTFPARSRLATEWGDACRRFGIVPGLNPREAAQRVTESLVKGRLLNALDLWLVTDPRLEVRTILGTADPDEYREQIRDVVLRGQADKLAELAGKVEALDQPAWFAAALGQLAAVPVPRRREVLETALQGHPRDLSLLISLGMTYPINRREGAEERVRWYQAAVTSHPGSIAARNGLGMALKSKGDLSGAVREYRAALALAPNVAPVRNNLGNALHDMGDLNGAIREYKIANDLAPNDAHTHNNLGVALHDKGQLDEAIREFRTAIELNPKLTNPHNGLGNALHDKGDLAGAIREYKIAIDLDAKSALPHNGLGRALKAKGDLKGAIREYEIAIGLDPRDAHTRNNLGNALSDAGDLDGAIREYKIAIDLDAKFALPHNGLGNALRSKGDRNGAIAAYREAARRKNRWAPTYNNLAVLLAARGEPFAALQALRDGLQIDPRFIAEFRYNLACFACRVASGGAKDAPAQVDRSGLRREALGWLTDELAVAKRHSDDARFRPIIHEAMRHWLADSDLDSVRDVEKVPVDEREKWTQFWSDVRQLRADTAPAVAPAPRPVK